MHPLQSYNTAFMRQVYSPRSQLSLYMTDIQKNKINLIINIDKQKLSLIKNQFQNHSNIMDKFTFINTCLNILNQWQKDLPYRQSRLIAYLKSLFDQIDDKQNKQHITWQQFNNRIIQKALNLKFLQTQDTPLISKLKFIPLKNCKIKFPSPIIKIISIAKYKKLAYLCQQSNKIQFYSLISTTHHYRPLLLDRQDLLVQKSLIKRSKNQKNGAIIKQNYKKQVVVSSYPVIFLDMIYIYSQKYQMLMTSSTDGIVRGWDITATMPVLLKQPQNQQQKMSHQFPLQIQLMVWDQINQILYCATKPGKIYLWLIKTDTQKQLSHIQSHHSIISSMIMLPKLQFLVTGDQDGKLILWDTISMNKKFKYQQHTRSIVSITFHQQLILLFTASFDHSICVWNPYIPSLIHKISCNLNVVQVHIIKGTNYLAALDMGSNLKIRQVKKFNLISTFVIDRTDQTQSKSQVTIQNGFNISPNCFTMLQTRFYFGGTSIKCMQFDQNQQLACLQFFPTYLKHNEQKFKLYVVIKNNILIWNLLTGQLYDILQNQSEQQITCIALIPNSSKFVIGDNQGSIYLRNIQSGVKISKMYKSTHKVSVNILLAKRGGVWKQSVIIAIYQDCQIAIFSKDQSSDYAIKSFNLKKYFPNVLILSAQYQQQRNLLILSTNKNDIICMDIDKNRIANHIQTQNFQCIKFIIKHDIPSMIMFGKNQQILGMYLPPHSKKYRTSCNLLIASPKPQRKVISIAMSQLSDRCFIGYQDFTISKLLLPSKLINNQLNISSSTLQKQITKISIQWQQNLLQLPKDIILINQQKIIAVILFMKNITLLSTENGQVINTLPSYARIDPDRIFYGNPLFYYNNTTTNLLQKQRSKQHPKKDKQSKHQIYLQQTKKYYTIDPSSKPIGDNTYTQDLRIFHDPYYLYQQYLNIIKQIHRKKQFKFLQNQQTNSLTYYNNQNKNIIWNHQWNIFPQFKSNIQKQIEQINYLQTLIQINNQKPQLKFEKTFSQINKDNVNKAVQVQKKWQQLKDYIQDQGTSKSTNPKLITLSSFKQPLDLRQKDKKQQKYYDSKKIYKQSPINLKNIQIQQSIIKYPNKTINMIKHKSLQTSSSSPLIRLGLALQKVNQKDQRAVKFILLGQKQQNNQIQKGFKLPKIKYKFGKS